MKNRTTEKIWFPFWADKWIFGSMRIEFNTEERGIWIDLMAVASKDNGYIRANEETPYPIKQLAGMLRIPEDKLNDAIENFIKKKKLRRYKIGTLKITRWEKYQFSGRYMRKLTLSNEEFTIDKIYKKTSISCPIEFSEMATKSNIVKMNRLIIAIILNRSLTKKEEVHHINKIENDNRPDNLMLFKNHMDHKRFEHGYEIDPLWNGEEDLTEKDIKKIESFFAAKINSAGKSAVGGEKTAPYTIQNNTIQNNKKTISPVEASIILGEFKEFWEAYPRKIEKEDAFLAFKALRRKESLKTIAKATNGYNDWLKKERLKKNLSKKEQVDYIKYPASFLRKNKWKTHLNFKYTPRL